MGSSFFELNVATTGLFAAKTGLQVTSNNIANASVKGYSRQVVLQKASSSLKKFNGIGKVGTGTNVYGVGQIRDVYLDKKYWEKQATLGEYSQKKTQLTTLESIFNSLEKTGLTNTINTFFSSISDLSFTAADLDYRNAVISNTEILISDLKSYANEILKQQSDVNDEVYATVNKINQIGSQLVSLNYQIYNSELDGHTANELRDERAVLIDELSKYANIETKEISDGTDRELGKKFVVLINGQEFVSHNNYRTLNCEPRQNPLHKNDALNLYDINWSNGDNFDINGLKGELKGLIDIRDGDSGQVGGNYKGIPYYINKMNEFVRTLACAMNTGKRLDGTKINGVIGHIDGFDLNGNNGNLFFSFVNQNGTINTNTNFDYNDLDVFNLSISQALKDSPKNLATSDTNDPQQESNNKVILGFLTLKDNKTLFSEGGAYQFVNALASTLGIDVKQSEKFSLHYEDISKAVDNQRLQVSGVSLNEEVSNMIIYQQLYQTSSKLINIINEIYNTTINGMGV